MEGNPRDRWRRKRFKENLDRLLIERGLTRKAASDVAGVDYGWLRRAVSRGIAWPDKRSMERLKKLCGKLGLDDVERLWGRHFVVPPEPSSIKDEADKLGEEMRRYVLLVGAEDATLKGIVEQMRRAARTRKLADDEAKLTPSTSPSSESVGDPPSPSRSPGGVWPTTTPSTRRLTMAERVAHARRAILEGCDESEAVGRERTSGGPSPAGRESSIPTEEPQSAFGAGDRSGGPSRDGAFNQVAQHPAGSSIGRPRSKWVDGLIAELARRILVDFDHQYIQGFREMGLPRVEDVTMTAVEFLSHAESSQLDLTGDDAFHLAHLPWLERYGELLGTTWQTADSYITAWRFFWERRQPSDGDASPGGQPSDALAELRFLSPDALIAGHDRERGKEVAEEFRRIRETARPLVDGVLESLSPAQHAHFFEAFDSPERGELHLLNELTRLIRNTGIDAGRPFPPDASDEAVRGLVAEIVEDFEKSRHGEGGDDLALLTSDAEAVVAPSKSLDFRHGGDPPLDDDHGDRPPVGAALEAEIARSIAEDREALERRVNDFWEMLGDTPLPGGVGTYRDRSEGLGDRMTVASAALRACDGDIGKALRWLTDRVDRAIEDEKLLAAKRTTPARAADEAPPPAKRPVRRKRPIVADPEDVREAVVECHRMGMPTHEIIADLRRRLDMPDWVRRAKNSVLRGEIGKIVTRYEAEMDDEAAPDEFDARGEDDKRAWEMGYEEDPDDRYWRGGRS